jgi:hypothetical protein
MVELSIPANPILQISNALQQHRRPSNGGGDKIDIVGGITGM